MRHTARSPVSREVSIELQRVVERWRLLPLDHALSHVGRVRVLVQTLADTVAGASGVASSVVPDLGPATLMDQLTVMVHDASAIAGTSTAAATVAVKSASDRSAASAVGSLAEDLARLRRELR